MKKVVAIFLLIYYGFAMFAFPMCDFSMVKDIPQMYQHCKATEDKDLTAFDFITDHLIDFDCIFDSHDENDEQKSHQSNINHRLTFTVQLNTTPTTIVIVQKQAIAIAKNTPNFFYSNNYSFTHSLCVFRPPIV